MHVPCNALPVNDHLSGHTPKLEKVYLLAVKLQYTGLRVRQTDKRQVVLRKVSGKSLFVFWTDHKDGGFPLNKILKVLAQLRHVLLAEWSGKAAVEYQQDVLFPFVIREMDGLTLKILQGEIRGRGIQCYFWHG